MPAMMFTLFPFVWFPFDWLLRVHVTAMNARSIWHGKSAFHLAREKRVPSNTGI